MCGVLAYSGTRKINLEKAMRELAHRGPDATGIVQEGIVTLAHQRLSIIDVSARSNQPMKSRSGLTTISFNGEIYNYRDLRTSLEKEGIQFLTESDTEVILEGYERHGTEFFSRLRGMWGFVIHDKRSKELILVRDPFGIKPLYWTVQGASLYVASELRALQALDLSFVPNPDSYAVFFNLGYFIAPATPYKDVYKLRPGEVLSWRINENKIEYRASISRFVKVPSIAEVSTYADQLNALDQMLTESVEAHYVSDVPVSILLSGGTDSSLIAALSTKLGKRPAAYHVAVKKSDDTSYAEAIARHLGLKLIVEPLSQDALVQQYEKVWSVSDEPTGDLSIIPTSLIFERIKGLSKVVLSGEGGDELFGGYLRHSLLAKHSHTRRKSTLDTFFSHLYGTGTNALAYTNPLIGRTREFFLDHGVPNDLLGAYLRSARLIDFPLHDAHMHNVLADIYRTNETEHIPSGLAFDLIAYLPNDLLPKSDISSMASSIEARVPFVDRIFASGARTIRAANGQSFGKRILQDVLARYLPHDLAYRGKSGFGVPLDAYNVTLFTSDFREACRFHLMHRGAFAINGAFAELIGSEQARILIAHKFPRFAFALVSNWKFLSGEH